MKTYEEKITLKDGTEKVRRFFDMDGGAHFKWTFFSLGGKEYPIGSFDILLYHEIDWSNTKAVAE